MRTSVHGLGRSMQEMREGGMEGRREGMLTTGSFGACDSNPSGGREGGQGYVLLSLEGKDDDVSFGGEGGLGRESSKRAVGHPP